MYLEFLTNTIRISDNSWSVAQYFGSDIVFRDDGKCLVSFTGCGHYLQENPDPMKVYLAVIEDYYDVLHCYNVGKAFEYAILENPLYGFFEGRLFRIRSDDETPSKIYLFVRTDVSNIQTIYCYCSDDGLGENFNLIGVVNQVERNTTAGSSGIGSVAFHKGRLFLTYNLHHFGTGLFSGQTWAQQWIAYSDDYGSTWVNKCFFRTQGLWVSPGGYFHNGICISETPDIDHIAHLVLVGGIRMTQSYDNGTTWDWGEDGDGLLHSGFNSSQYSGSGSTFFTGEKDHPYNYMVRNDDSTGGSPRRNTIHRRLKTDPYTDMEGFSGWSTNLWRRYDRGQAPLATQLSGANEGLIKAQFRTKEDPVTITWCGRAYGGLLGIDDNYRSIIRGTADPAPWVGGLAGVDGLGIGNSYSFTDINIIKDSDYDSYPIYDCYDIGGNVGKISTNVVEGTQGYENITFIPGFCINTYTVSNISIEGATIRNVGALCGKVWNASKLYSSYYDIELSSHDDDDGRGEPRTTEEMKYIPEYDTTYINWDFVEYEWYTSPDRWEAAGGEWFVTPEYNWGYPCFIGWLVDPPIIEADLNTIFNGYFDGNWKVFYNGSINMSEMSYIGFFTYLGESSRLKKLGIENFTVEGSEQVGIIAGSNQGLIELTYVGKQCSVTGIEDVGGFVGRNEGTIANCYARGAVSGATKVGGFVGFNTVEEDSAGIILKCYSTGKVN